MALDLFKEMFGLKFPEKLLYKRLLNETKTDTNEPGNR